MAMDVAIGAEIADNVERIINVLESPPRFIAAVTPLAEVLLENFSSFIRIDLRNDLAQLMQRLAGMRIKNGQLLLFPLHRCRNPSG